MEIVTQRKFMRMADILANRKFHIGQQVGEGTYSRVYTAESATDGNTYAVKVLDKTKVRTDYLKKFMPRELDIILKLKHPNVINTLEIIQKRDFVFQIMEYADEGDVLHMIQRREFIPEEKCRRIVRDVTRGLQYIHDLNIAHRDLKCENILMFSDGRATISDFGFSRAFDVGTSNTTCQTFCGSTAYASPELLRGIPYDPNISDVWSLGVITFTMLCGSMPFDDSNVTRLVRKQTAREITFPEKRHGDVTASARQFVRQVLEPDINVRPTPAQILEMTWIPT